MGVKISSALFGYLIFTLVFLTNIGIIRSTELQPGEAFVCGPRTVYGRFKVIERTYEECETGSCLVEKEIYVTEKQAYYCCQGHSQTGTSCSQECDADHYGENCTQICNCAAEHATGCNSVSGKCDCVPGKGGANCIDDCAQGTFGVSCRGTCNCSHIDDDAICEPINGTCSCSSEFYGDKCEFRYSTTTANTTKIGSTQVLSRKTLAPLVREGLGASVIIPITCVGIVVLVITALLTVWKCARKENGVTQQPNPSTIASDPYYSFILENVTQGAGSPTRTTSLNLETRSGINDSHNASDQRGAHSTSTDLVAYATSIGVSGATRETAANSLTHTYMEGQQNVSALGSQEMFASSQASTDDIIAYAESEAVPQAKAKMTANSITHSYMEKSLNMSGLAISNAEEPVCLRTIRRNSSTTATGPYYSSIPENVTQGADSTAGTTSLNQEARVYVMNDSENSSDLRGAHDTSTDPVAYATSIGIFGATAEKTANSITHTYMKGQQHVSAPVEVPRVVENATTIQTSTDDIVAYAESEAVSTGESRGDRDGFITHSYMDSPLHMSGLGISNANDPVAYRVAYAMSDRVHSYVN